MLLLQWITVLSTTSVPAGVGWGPLILGLVLEYLAVTGPGTDFRRPLPPLAHHAGGEGGATFTLRNKRRVRFLRSQYEEQIRQAARQEERARLARDLHDAVKQQLFVIQTAAATAQARLDTDREGSKAAVDQVRSAAREAMTEMEAMLDQLQATPLANAGLVASLKKQCEALEFRSGAHVAFELGPLPADRMVDPGARQAIFRVAQEALANVARHARARNVAVTLADDGGHLVLTVRDDGSGFKPEGTPSGMGMANIAARAAEVGGGVDVTSSSDRGTTVRFSVPCRQQLSARPYAIRAVAWSVVLVSAVTYLTARGFDERPWGAIAILIAAFAVARYTLAAWRLRRPEATA
jgi:signal transduction histidine kinase